MKLLKQLAAVFLVGVIYIAASSGQWRTDFAEGWNSYNDGQSGEQKQFDFGDLVGDDY